MDCAIGEKDPLKGNGGIPQRTIAEVLGVNQSGKTLLVENVTKTVLEDNEENQVIMVNTEEPDMGRIKSLGIDMDRLNLLGCFEDEETKLKTAERQLEIVKRAVQDESVKLVVIDSLKALCSSKQIYDKKGDIKELEDAEQMAIRAKLVGDFVRDFVILNKKAILLMTNQISEQIGINYELGSELRIKTPAGRYKEYMAHLRILTTSRPIYTEKEHPLTGKKLLKGWECWWKLIKNKFSNKSGCRTAMTEFYFDPPGFRRSEEVLKLAEFLGLVDKGGGGFYTIDNTKVRGYDKAIAILDNNLKLRESLELQILSRSEDLFTDKSDGDVDLLA